jgi:hypothetical protein
MFHPVSTAKSLYTVIHGCALNGVVRLIEQAAKAPPHNTAPKNPVFA